MCYIQEADGSYTRSTLFDKDNFTARRTTGNNAYCPQSLLTGAEEQAGLSYEDPRVWPDWKTYFDAVDNKFPIEEIPVRGPRVKLSRFIKHEGFVLLPEAL